MHHSERDMASSHAEPTPQMLALMEELKRAQSEHGLGATGEFPEGKLDASDEGEIKIGIAKVDGKVVINFGKPVAWFGMTPQQARQLAESIRKASYAQ